MKFVLAAVTAALLLTAQTVTADAKGCIKGALVGGVAGDMVGHGKMSAAAGCVVGHHNANKKQQQQQGNRTAQATNYGRFSEKTRRASRPAFSCRRPFGACQVRNLRARIPQD